jgi:hypothetical protein|tara:strand:+ start:1135 stop:1734 length:600 start_codon:yes stop_codon:yes gene_type:complete
MASEYAKNKALMKKIREPKVRKVDFGLGDPVNYVQNISDIYDNTNNKFINHPVKGVIKENELKQFDSLDRSTYPSDPIQRQKLQEQELKDTKLFKYIDDVKRGDTKKYEKDEEKLFAPILDRIKIKGQRALKKKPVANNFNVDISGLSKDFNNYLELKKQFEKPVLPKVEPKVEPRVEGGLNSILESDLYYRRKKGMDF